MASAQTNTHAREQTRREEQAHKDADAARAGTEKLADFRQRATAEAWKSLESSVDAASQRFQNASDQVARTLGYSGEEGERLARQSAQNVEAITKLGTVLSQALQDTSRGWCGLAEKQLQRNLEGMGKLAHCRSVQDFTAVQSGLVRESLRHMVEDSRSIVEISLRAVNDAGKAVAVTGQEQTGGDRPSALSA
jgi:phasin protein